MPAIPIDIPNPNSGIDMVKHSNGHVYIVYNDDPNSRRDMTVARIKFSNDVKHPKLIKTSKVVVESEGPTSRDRDEANRSPQSGELSYPYMIEAPNGQLDLVYTYGRYMLRQIKLDV
jgi:predicted neuraminidase